MHPAVGSLAIWQEHLDLRTILDNISMDPASVFVYLLLAGSIALIILGSRKKGKRSR